MLLMLLLLYTVTVAVAVAVDGAVASASSYHVDAAFCDVWCLAIRRDSVTISSVDAALIPSSHNHYSDANVNRMWMMISCLRYHLQ